MYWYQISQKSHINAYVTVIKTVCIISALSHISLIFWTLLYHSFIFWSHSVILTPLSFVVHHALSPPKIRTSLASSPHMQQHTSGSHLNVCLHKRLPLQSCYFLMEGLERCAHEKCPVLRGLVRAGSLKISQFTLWLLLSTGSMHNFCSFFACGHSTAVSAHSLLTDLPTSLSPLSSGSVQQVCKNYSSTSASFSFFLLKRCLWLLTNWSLLIFALVSIWLTEQNRWSRNNTVCRSVVSSGISASIYLWKISKISQCSNLMNTSERN